MGGPAGRPRGETEASPRTMRDVFQCCGRSPCSSRLRFKGAGFSTPSAFFSTFAESRDMAPSQAGHGEWATAHDATRRGRSTGQARRRGPAAAGSLASRRQAP